ncbi:site-specific DNA-methyltransferase [Mycoplasma bradburyae]|uniref:site-specific DNA-methyltransferase n=1 Tax=Mycoplasma bradburyae TaxID=2963128 RepID=UPI0023401263|nr:site-specific DNA-methyltransferase [Mycoplasma bradburyae]MDC4183004.1 site-specific DNA-methyltransferase [Mycoplasma bradburyae]
MMRWNLLFSSKIRERERERESNNYLYDVIYIDPPYNTEHAAKDGNGVADDKENKQNKKFIYRDKFSRNGWLNMMQERLVLARKLLKEDGVIFVSIDDSEHAYLKVLMDEIFGEENFIANLNYQKKNSGSAADAKYIKQLTEYVLFYSKNINQLKLNSIKQDIDGDSSYKESDQYEAYRGKFKLNQLDRASLTWSEGLDYPITIDNIVYYAGGSEDNWKLRKSGNHAQKDWRWRWSEKKVKWGLENDFIVVKNGKIYSKQYQYVDENNNPLERTSKFSNIIEASQNTVGTEEQKNIFNRKVFDHPKPVDLIKNLLNMTSNKNARVLDFFAGSGTTAHAVMDLNREDDGNRTFTLVTNNENDTGYGIAYERIYRISQGKGTDGESFKWLKKNEPYNIGFNIYDIQQMDLSISNNKDVKEFEMNVVNMLKNFGLEKPEEIELIKLRALKTIDKEQHE